MRTVYHELPAADRQFTDEEELVPAVWRISSNAEEANGYDLVKGTSKYRLFDLTGQWQTFSMETVKTGVPTERTAVRLEVRSAGNVTDLDDVYVTPLSAGKR